MLLSEIKIINKWTLIYRRCSLKWFQNPVNVSRVFVLRLIQKLIAWSLVAWQQASCIFIIALPAVINIQTQWHTLSVPKLSWQSRLLLVMKSTKCTILRIYFFNIKVLWDFPGLNKKNSWAFPGASRASKIFQGFPGFPGPVRTLKAAANFTEISRKHVFEASNRNIIKNRV